MKVLWVSRHIPEDAELAELRTVYGQDMTVDQYGDHVTNIEDVILMAQKYEVSSVCTSLPIRLNQRLLHGLRPLNISLIRPVYRHRDARGNITAGNRGKFIGFEQFLELNVVSVRIGTWNVHCNVVPDVPGRE
ncbi:MAG: hypothetical protein Q8P23_01280 [bacterium]|nr:hypothetical protein [bacterium]